MKIVHVAATRPNFMKIAPIMEALNRRGGFTQQLVHTGQHYDFQMSEIFFRELGLPRPDAHLGIGSGTHAQQTGNTMIAFEKYLEQNSPEMVLVVGDVNATAAAALSAAKLNIPVCHVEAGLRSFDRAMPEEINRLVADVLSAILFPPSDEGRQNLLHEGVPPEKIFLVGDVMVDTLLTRRHLFEDMHVSKKFSLKNKNYGVVTFHRPSNVDNPARLDELVRALAEVSKLLPLVFSVHPRTLKNLKNAGLYETLTAIPNIHLTEPMGYLGFMSLISESRLVISDSGGVQTETTVLRVPCLTLRSATEKNITLTSGTNRLLGEDAGKLVPAVQETLAQKIHDFKLPEGWDGHASDRIAQVLAAL